MLFLFYFYYFISTFYFVNYNYIIIIPKIRTTSIQINEGSDSLNVLINNNFSNSIRNKSIKRPFTVINSAIRCTGIIITIITVVVITASRNEDSNKEYYEFFIKKLLNEELSNKGGADLIVIIIFRKIRFSGLGIITIPKFTNKNNYKI